MSALHKTELGQALLILTCLFYLAFWYHGYRPDEAVVRNRGITGLFLALTALSGIAGTACSLYGLNGFAKGGILSGGVLIGGAVIVYILLMAVTRVFFHRPVTTELLLIVSWGLLELCLISTLAGSGILAKGKAVFFLVLLLCAFVFSMVLYVAYYRMSPWPAFWWAMGPLISEAAVMLVYLILLVI